MASLPSTSGALALLSETAEALISQDDASALVRSDHSTVCVSATLKHPKQSGKCNTTATRGSEKRMPFLHVAQIAKITQSVENIRTDIPDFVREHESTLTFPEKLMLMLAYVEKTWKNQNEAPVVWSREGHAFTVQNPEILTSDIIPIFFERGKFSSFKRKLYRWGFRQASIPSSTEPMIDKMNFANDYFRRDNKDMMVKMKSTIPTRRRRTRKDRQKEQTQTEAAPQLDDCTSAVGTKRTAEDLGREEVNALKRRALFVSNRLMTIEHPAAKEALREPVTKSSTTVGTLYSSQVLPSDMPDSSEQKEAGVQQGADLSQSAGQQPASRHLQEHHDLHLFLKEQQRIQQSHDIQHTLLSSIPHQQMHRLLIKYVAIQKESTELQKLTGMNILQLLQQVQLAESKADRTHHSTYSMNLKAGCVSQQSLLTHRQAQLPPYQQSVATVLPALQQTLGLTAETEDLPQNSMNESWALSRRDVLARQRNLIHMLHQQDA